MTRMDEMYIEAKATVVGAAASIPALTFHFNVSLDPKVGPITSLTCETPLDCSLDIASEMLSAIVPVSHSSQPSANTQVSSSCELYGIT